MRTATPRPAAAVRTARARRAAWGSRPFSVSSRRTTRVPPVSAGATLICDMREASKRIDPGLFREVKKRGIQHTTSECTLRGFTCSIANVDPKTATPAEIVKIRKIQTGYQVDGITGGLAVQDNEKDKNQ